MKNSLSVLFYLRKSKVAEYEKAPIYIRITVNGRRVDLATHQFIESERWDSQHGCLKGTKEDARTINTDLDNKRSSILKIFTQLETAGKPITAEIIRNHFLGKTINRHSLIEVFQLFNKQLEAKVGHGYSYSTLEKYTATCQKVENFIKYQYHRTDLFLDELDYQFIANY